MFGWLGCWCFYVLYALLMHSTRSCMSALRGCSCFYFCCPLLMHAAHAGMFAWLLLLVFLNSLCSPHARDSWLHVRFASLRCLYFTFAVLNSCTPPMAACSINLAACVFVSECRTACSLSLAACTFSCVVFSSCTPFKAAFLLRFGLYFSIRCD